VLQNFICDFSEWSQDVQHLHIAQCFIMPTCLLDSISLLNNLCTLNISPIYVGNFQEFRALAPLALESLTLGLSCPLYTRLPDPITPLPDFLVSLENLDISGPLIAVADFVQSLGSRRLTSLVVEAGSKHVICDQHVSLMEAENVNVCNFGSMLHTIHCVGETAFEKLPSLRRVVHASTFPSYLVC